MNGQTDTGRQQGPRLRIASRGKSLCFLIFKWFYGTNIFQFQLCSLFLNLETFGPEWLYCLNCTECGWLILRKIIKIIATRSQIFRLKYTKFDFGWDS